MVGQPSAIDITSIIIYHGSEMTGDDITCVLYITLHPALLCMRVMNDTLNINASQCHTCSCFDHKPASGIIVSVDRYYCWKKLAEVLEAIK